MTKKTIKEVIKIGLTVQGINITELSRRVGKTSSTMSNTFIRNKPNLAITLQSIKELGGRVIVEFDDLSIELIESKK